MYHTYGGGKDSYYLGTNENILSSPAKIQRFYLSEVMIHLFIHSRNYGAPGLCQALQ